uniref:histone-lysine N-methyltransferase ASHR2 n=1 Tax=Erigeron canadensis TaxID=72917 RepID=UPI001CB91B83|nr:histone-lysine N-methyltransferase ASHR2 [Erigeron canadensis]
METPAAISMIEIPGRGRSMVALRPLKAGEVILKDSPIILYSALPFHPTNPQNIYCSNCFIKISNHPQKISCPTCSSSQFCTPNCQAVASTTSHTPWVCQMTSYLQPYFSENRLPFDTQLQARYLVSAYNLAVVSPTKFQTLLSLDGSGGGESDQTVNFLHSLIGSVCKPMPAEIGFCLELTCALLAKDKVNAFGLMEPFDEEREERSVRAYGIYPVASFFNHDCLPNACRFDYIDVSDGMNVGKNSEISIRMIHDVVEGREICLSYFPVNLKYSERQKRLKDEYGFACECDRCKVEANWSDSEDDGVEMDDGDDGKDEGEETTMDEDVDEEMEGQDGSVVLNGDEGEFPHSYFFLNYMCDRKNCWGTLAPLPPSVATSHSVMECNVCGNFRKLDQV